MGGFSSLVFDGRKPSDGEQLVPFFLNKVTISMIHIATVHWLDETWVDIQSNYFSRWLGDTPARVYTYLNGIDVEKYRDRFFYISDEPIVPHITKLNLLAEKITENSEPDDILLFIDGDAFPVGDFVSYIKHQLKSYPLVAVQRLENEGDPQPHPSFCATTVRFWNEIKGDWSKGPKWKTETGGLRSDTGGVLWERLNSLGIEWKPMLRSNVKNLHPLWFGIYENVAYHHGAAFRAPYCTLDISEAAEVYWKKVLMNFANTKIMSRIRGGWFQNAVYTFVMKKRIQQTRNDSMRILDEIRNDQSFFQSFIS